MTFTFLMVLKCQKVIYFVTKLRKIQTSASVKVSLEQQCSLVSVLSVASSPATAAG